ncbi:MAG TPA: hypothetical protein VND21_04730, partial [Planctomycetota bacterium]|nr:hypothetical protein [Planctomycetota bacterium]
MKRTAILAGLLAIVLGGAARAADAPPSPEDLLRQAKTTESADRDVPKAIELYERVLAGVGDAERRALYETLEAKRIKGLQFVDQSLDQVVTYLRTVTGLNFFITPRVRDSGRADNVRVNVARLDDVTAREVLDLVTAPHELGWESRDGVITIALREEIATARRADTSAVGAAREAALRLLHLREARGEREEARKMAVLLWTDLAKGLTPEQIALVRAALGRLLEPGRSVTGPHGSIYVDAPKVVEGGLSPLEQTILEQLRTLKGTDGDRRGFRESEITDALSGVGREALPALEYAIRHEGSDLAPYAARLYAQLAGSDAFALFEDLLR